MLSLSLYLFAGSKEILRKFDELSQESWIKTFHTVASIECGTFILQCLHFQVCIAAWIVQHISHVCCYHHSEVSVIYGCKEVNFCAVEIWGWNGTHLDQQLYLCTWLCYYIKAKHLVTDTILYFIRCNKPFGFCDLDTPGLGIQNPSASHSLSTYSVNITKKCIFYLFV